MQQAQWVTATVCVFDSLVRSASEEVYEKLEVYRMPPYSILFLQSRSELFRRIFKAKWMQSSSPSLRTCVDERNLRAWKLLWPSQCVSSFVLLCKYLYPMCTHFSDVGAKNSCTVYSFTCTGRPRSIYSKLFWEVPMKGRHFRFAQRSRLPTLAKLM